MYLVVPGPDIGVPGLAPAWHVRNGVVVAPGGNVLSDVCVEVFHREVAAAVGYRAVLGDHDVLRRPAVDGRQNLDGNRLLELGEVAPGAAVEIERAVLATVLLSHFDRQQGVSGAVGSDVTGPVANPIAGVRNSVTAHFLGHNLLGAHVEDMPVLLIDLFQQSELLRHVKDELVVVEPVGKRRVERQVEVLEALLRETPLLYLRVDAQVGPVVRLVPEDDLPEKRRVRLGLIPPHPALVLHRGHWPPAVVEPGLEPLRLFLGADAPASVGFGMPDYPDLHCRPFTGRLCFEANDGQPFGNLHGSHTALQADLLAAYEEERLGVAWLHGDLEGGGRSSDGSLDGNPGVVLSMESEGRIVEGSDRPFARKVQGDTGGSHPRVGWRIDAFQFLPFISQLQRGELTEELSPDPSGSRVLIDGDRNISRSLRPDRDAVLRIRLDSPAADYQRGVSPLVLLPFKPGAVLAGARLCRGGEYPGIVAAAAHQLAICHLFKSAVLEEFNSLRPGFSRGERDNRHEYRHYETTSRTKGQSSHFLTPRNETRKIHLFHSPAATPRGHGANSIQKYLRREKRSDTRQQRLEARLPNGRPQGFIKLLHQAAYVLANLSVLLDGGFLFGLDALTVGPDLFF